MFFTRTHRYTTLIAKEDLRNRLLGQHLTVHKLDFEVLDDDGIIRVIPHAEEIEEIKTLPITSIRFVQDGKTTKVEIKSKMRKFDAGGPLILVLFCLFLIVFSVVLFFASKDGTLSYMLLAFGVVILTIFWIRMELGYFDYVRKIHTYLKAHLVK